ncbi:MAG: hypothetical protein D6808_02990 [Candidatus Dadabacteria bacterium]|nr:MAG: hypothetical protein D6808_02990 [Candidatus Dadabacteria bacterium]
MEDLLADTLYKWDRDRYETLLCELEKAAKRTFSDCSSGQRFAGLQSYIPVSTSDPVPESLLYLYDIGGTNIRGGLCAVRDRMPPQFYPLFIVNNKEVVSGKREDSFSEMIENIISLSIERAPELNPSAFQRVGLGIVWSNALQNYPLKLSADGLEGVSGTVTGKDRGGFYKKNEPWNDSIRDGDDIGKAFVEAFGGRGISFNALVVTNDTIFTQKVIPGARSGMVASTGANVTCTKPGEETLRNSEAGNAFILPEDLTDDFDIIEGDSLDLETLLCGRGIQRRLGRQIVWLSESGSLNRLGYPLSDYFRRIADFLKRENRYLVEFCGEDLSELAKGDYKGFLKRRKEDIRCLFEEDTLLRALTVMASNLGRIGGRYAAALAYASIALELKEGYDKLVIALDSSQAHFMPHYWEEMHSFFSSIISSRYPERSVKIELIKPQEGNILSVPMLGAANALFGFL